jgi:hypothetical protein
MKPYIVKQGDYLDKIAHALGFDSDKVWDDPRNADLKNKRDPNLLHPGDILYVPETEPHWLVLKAGTVNRYVARIPKTTVKLGFKNRKGPLANEPYVVQGLGAPLEGTTDGEGRVVLEVPVHVRECQVVFAGQGVIYPVQVGDMDPIDEPTGVRKRLQHLGYGRADGDDEQTDDDAAVKDRLAILAFQHDHGLMATGIADDATRAVLANAHEG